MIIVYSKIKKSELDAEIPNAIKQITDWFNANPKRRICNAKLWYEQNHKIRRKSVEADIKAVAEKTDTIEG